MCSKEQSPAKIHKTISGFWWSHLYRICTLRGSLPASILSSGASRIPPGYCTHRGASHPLNYVAEHGIKVRSHGLKHPAYLYASLTTQKLIARDCSLNL